MLFFFIAIGLLLVMLYREYKDPTDCTCYEDSYSDI